MPARVDRTEAIERVLTNVYLKLFDDIQSDPKFPNNLYDLRKQYNQKVYTVTRKAIEQVYNDGISYVARKTKIDTYVTETDLNNIKKLTDKGVNSFWKRIESDAQRKKDNDVIATFMPDLDVKKDFDTDHFLSAVSTMVSFASLALATRSKVQQINDQIVPEITTQEITDAETGLVSLTEGEGPTQRLIWTTAGDERVCESFEGGPGCADLDGTEWDIDDPDIEEPPLHENCRCWLDIVTD